MLERSRCIRADELGGLFLCPGATGVHAFTPCDLTCPSPFTQENIVTRRKTMTSLATAATAVTSLVGLSLLSSPAQAANESIHFKMVRSSASVSAGCLHGARAKVTIVSHSQTQTMTIRAHGLPKNTGFDVFVTQLPNAPFGLSWYQSDLESNNEGRAEVTVKGRFNIETFAVAPGVGVAAQPHGDKDASTNPAFAPIHTFHVGFWFNSPKGARRAGCLDTVTPFNGDHHAGPQAMSTRNFPDKRGPLRHLGD
jgi:hypothetical protein